MWPNVVIAGECQPLYPPERLYIAPWTCLKSSLHNSLAVRGQTQHTKDKHTKTHHYGVFTVNRKLKPNVTHRLMVDVHNCRGIGGGGISEGVSVKTLDIFHNLMVTEVEN